MLIDSSQTKMLNFNRDDIMCLPLYRFFPAATAIPAMAAIDKVFKTGLTVWHAYSLAEHAFLCLLEKIDNGVVAIHEVLDDPDDRPDLKKFLLAASGNFHRDLYRKNEIMSLYIRMKHPCRLLR